MGMCVSCESVSVATAKVILQDGRLQEYSYPVKASYVLSKDNNNNNASFICNSDDMEFDEVVSAVKDDEELQPGQLYFVLPLSKLRRPLQAEEMAGLAVKANAALLNSGGSEKCSCRKKGGASFFRGGEKVADGGATRTRSGNRRTKRSTKKPGPGPQVVRVIQRDGKMKEFNPPICAAQILSQNPDCILCSSDSMFVDSYLDHVPEPEELSPGHLYFLMPKSKAQMPLSLEDLCELAIKASSNICVDDLQLSFRQYAPAG
ncbi:hypothetical protein Cgig2_025613 [Carnegiea gigantea]|uniref:Uncharacterized protein n=1 Tax=Carnegiea gigantea TaxID=171969 RepID=A0A9Q1JVA3_9CARY|nr:hypothetical protein Cgig2_025613 [Carnegiea gigantea]